MCNDASCCARLRDLGALLLLPHQVTDIFLGTVPASDPRRCWLRPVKLPGRVPAEAASQVPVDRWSNAGHYCISTQRRHWWEPQDVPAKGQSQHLGRD
jgi:hypothetical protein